MCESFHMLCILFLSSFYSLFLCVRVHVFLNVCMRVLRCIADDSRFMLLLPFVIVWLLDFSFLLQYRFLLRRNTTFLFRKAVYMCILFGLDFTCTRLLQYAALCSLFLQLHFDLLEFNYAIVLLLHTAVKDADDVFFFFVHHTGIPP